VCRVRREGGAAGADAVGSQTRRRRQLMRRGLPLGATGTVSAPAHGAGIGVAAPPAQLGSARLKCRLSTHCGHSEATRLCGVVWTTLPHPVTASAALIAQLAGAPVVVEQLLKLAVGRKRHRMKS
jgi:hypothetical protein